MTAAVPAPPPARLPNAAPVPPGARPVCDFWEAVAARHEIPPPAPPDPGEDLSRLDATVAVLIARLAVELPGPLPAELFDAAAARALAVAVHRAARVLTEARPPAPPPAAPRLRAAADAAAAAQGAIGTDAEGAAQALGALAQAIERVPSPAGAAAHVTLAALGWFAVPILRRLKARTFAAGENAAVAAAATQFGSLLARLPLLSLRPDAEATFVGDPAPELAGIEPAEGLRRWLTCRLATPCADPAFLARRAWCMERIWRTWRTPAITVREVLVLWAAALGPEPALGPLEDGWLLACAPLCARDAWPAGLDPALERRLAALLDSGPPPERTRDDDPS